VYVGSQPSASLEASLLKDAVLLRETSSVEILKSHFVANVWLINENILMVSECYEESIGVKVVVTQSSIGQTLKRTSAFV
jgi:hypothetical protein